MEPKYTKDDLITIITALEESKNVIADPLKAFESAKKLQKYPKEVIAFVVKSLFELFDKVESEEDYGAIYTILLTGINLIADKLEKENNSNNQNQN